MHHRFKNNLGDLSIRMNGTTYKHCGACGLRLQGNDKRLEAHYKRYHKDQEAAWLQYDDRPVHCCYINFETYLSNPDTELEIKPNFRFLGGGPLPAPRPPPFAINREVPPVRVLSTMSDVESCFFKRSIVDF